ncbi:MAG: 2-dehydropantoate 2-reductase [Nitrospinae bacterium]|nr:2-dehydropantoate 2-reductase [Nitrospinota bacterium]
MKIVIAGAGAVGAYYGAVLARAGHDVFFIARGAQLAAFREKGVSVKSVNGDFLTTVNCGDDSSTFGVADLILVCFKSYDTTATTGLYATSVGLNTSIISLQNGIDNEGILSERFGKDKVLGGVSFIGSRMEAPGIVVHTAASNITIGELSGGVSDRAGRLGEMFESANIRCKVSADIRRDMFAKMIWNIGFNAICAILDCSAQKALGFEETRNVILSAMLEWVAVAQAEGVALTTEMAHKNMEGTLKAGGIFPSMLQDRRAGRKMEIDIFNARAAQMGQKHGIPTPVNATLAAVIRFWNATTH